MILREYQKETVSKAVTALQEHKNTVVVAPTGAGKTVIMSALAREFKGAKTLILQHRHELVTQNKRTFEVVNPSWDTSLYTADCKDWNGQAVFAMVPTLCRPARVREMPSFDLVIADECHHAPAPSWARIIDRARELNDDVLLAGFTATPERSDGRGLASCFGNCSSQIDIKKLITKGFLVPPKTYVVDVGVTEKLRAVKRNRDDFDMEEVESIMNHRVINEEVVRKWQEKAGDRRSIFFCSTKAHAYGVERELKEQNIPAAVLTGDTPKGERMQILQDLKSGKLQIVVNVAVLTEGFDEPTVSCIVLLRPCSYKSVMIQMIGRGLRTCKKEIKTDCIVIDFGTSILTHGDIDAGRNLKGRKSEDGEDNMACPGCGNIIPRESRECPFCGCDPDIQDEEGESRETETTILDKVELTEFDLFLNSPFRWVDLFHSEKVLFATGFDAWVAVVSADGYIFKAIGGRSREKPELLATSAKLQAITAADDFMRCYETNDNSKKTRSWMNAAATKKQIHMLLRRGYDIKDPLFPPYSRYEAMAHITFQLNRQVIERQLFAVPSHYHYEAA